MRPATVVDSARAAAVRWDARRSEGVAGELAVLRRSTVQQRHSLEWHTVGVPAHQVAQREEHLRVGTRRRAHQCRNRNPGVSPPRSAGVLHPAREVPEPRDKTPRLGVGGGVADGAHDHIHVRAVSERLQELELGRPGPARQIDGDLPACLRRAPRVVSDLCGRRSEQLGHADAARERRARASHQLDHVSRPGALSGKGVERLVRHRGEVAVGASQRPEGRRLLPSARQPRGRPLGERSA
ncbi:MAG: hypothetical protein ACRDXC_04875, partial [Acidimicrobiales bacterium]